MAVQVYISGLPPEYLDDDLRRLCSTFGEILETRVLRETASRNHHATLSGFCRFARRAQSDAAILALHNYQIPAAGVSSGVVGGLVYTLNARYATDTRTRNKEASGAWLTRSHVDRGPATAAGPSPAPSGMSQGGPPSRSGYGGEYRDQGPAASSHSRGSGGSGGFERRPARRYDDAGYSNGGGGSGGTTPYSQAPHSSHSHSPSPTHASSHHGGGHGGYPEPHGPAPARHHDDYYASAPPPYSSAPYREPAPGRYPPAQYYEEEDYEGAGYSPHAAPPPAAAVARGPPGSYRGGGYTGGRGGYAAAPAPRYADERPPAEEYHRPHYNDLSGVRGGPPPSRGGGGGGSWRERRDPRDAYEPREAREPRDPRDLREPRDPRDLRDPRDGRDSRDSRDHRDPRDAHPRDVPPSGSYYASGPERRGPPSEYGGTSGSGGYAPRYSQPPPTAGGPGPRFQLLPHEPRPGYAPGGPDGGSGEHSPTNASGGGGAYDFSSVRDALPQ